MVVLSLRPVARVEAAVDVLAAPLRLAAELASPLRLVGRARALAAERRFADSAEEDLRQNLAVLEELAASALPSDPALRAGRRLVPAEVRARARGERDRLRIVLSDARGVVPGLPVVLGNAYVGRVAALGVEGSAGPEAEGMAEVELVTARGFHVGARVQEGPGGSEVFMTVGGVESEPARDARGERTLRLAVHNPSDRELAGGIARVHELFAAPDEPVALADGFLLGAVLHDGERWTILPELDCLDGLSRVVVVAPPAALAPLDAGERVLLDEDWLKVAPLALGDPAPWREAVKLGAGRARGVRPGAAVCSVGARLVGRVTRAGPWTADVSLLGDPGFHVVAVARFEDGGEPRALGRVVSLGRTREGRVRLRWVPRVSFGQEGGAAAEWRAAQLFTGSGERGLTSGLYLGEALVPLAVRRDEAVELELGTLAGPFEARSLFVRVEHEESVDAAADAEEGP
jgi:hypothetical protein